MCGSSVSSNQWCDHTTKKGTWWWGWRGGKEESVIHVSTGKERLKNFKDQRWREPCVNRRREKGSEKNCRGPDTPGLRQKKGGDGVLVSIRILKMGHAEDSVQLTRGKRLKEKIANSVSEIEKGIKWGGIPERAVEGQKRDENRSTRLQL